MKVRRMQLLQDETGMSVQEIALVLGVSHQRASVLVLKAMQSFRRELEARGIKGFDQLIGPMLRRE